LEIFFNILKASVAVLPNLKQTWCTYTALYTLTFYKWSKTSDDTKHIHTFQKVSDHYDTHYNFEINTKWDTTDFYPTSA
jgi:hypothetical protein